METIRGVDMASVIHVRDLRALELMECLHLFLRKLNSALIRRM
jgi:hypothetical protein